MREAIIMLATLACHSAEWASSFPFTLAGADGDLIGVIAVGGGLVVAITAIVFTQCRYILQTRAREKTRREIAAYVAEGSMTPDDAARLMGADASETERKIADAVSWGVLSAEKAEKLIAAIRQSGGEPGGGKPGY